MYLADILAKEFNIPDSPELLEKSHVLCPDYLCQRAFTRLTNDEIECQAFTIQILSCRKTQQN